jgi:glyoxylase-like metal-dependent hydrolase (beta-lactamase superfamily II)
MTHDPIHLLTLPRGTSALHPTLILDGDTALLVDTGLPNTLDQLSAELARFGVTPEHLTAVLITHHDIDHIGNLKALKAINPKLSVITSEGEVDFVEGKVQAQKLQDIASGALVIADDQKAWAETLTRVFPTLSTPVDDVVQDGDVLTIADGIEVIATPGHTLGHISLYHHATQTLISGDALNLNQGQLTGPNPRMTHDLEVAKTSLKKLATYPIQRILCFHGEELEGKNLQQHLEELSK